MTAGRQKPSTGIRGLEAAGILLCSVLWLVLAARAWRSVGSATDVGLALLALVVAYATADWVSGFAHWFCDTFFDEDTPVIGPALIEPFREHHRDPLAMTRHGFLELNGNNCLGLVLPLALAVWVGPETPTSEVAVFVTVFLTFFFLAIAVTNRLHGWAHAPTAPAAIRWMQARGLILSPERHANHHTAPYAQAYCVTHGWMNGPLDRVRFFETVAKLLTALGVPRTRKSGFSTMVRDDGS